MTQASVLFNTNITRLIFFASFLIATINVSGQLLQDTRRVIFLKETPVLFNLTKDTALQRFTPTSDDIDSVDSFLNQYFLTISNQGDKHPNVDNYYRQYVGFWIKGKKCIYINASCRQPDYFLKNTYYPKGGGECYFRTLVDLNDKKISDFYFNAPK